MPLKRDGPNCASYSSVRTGQSEKSMFLKSLISFSLFSVVLIIKLVLFAYFPGSFRHPIYTPALSACTQLYIRLIELSSVRTERLFQEQQIREAGYTLRGVRQSIGQTSSGAVFWRPCGRCLCHCSRRVFAGFRWLQPVTLVDFCTNSNAKIPIILHAFGVCRVKNLLIGSVIPGTQQVPHSWSGSGRSLSKRYPKVRPS
jgi:hypothetical protein